MCVCNECMRACSYAGIDVYAFMWQYVQAHIWMHMQICTCLYAHMYVWCGCALDASLLDILSQFLIIAKNALCCFVTCPYIYMQSAPDGCSVRSCHRRRLGWKSACSQEHRKSIARHARKSIGRPDHTSVRMISKVEVWQQSLKRPSYYAGVLFRKEVYNIYI